MSRLRDPACTIQISNIPVCLLKLSLAVTSQTGMVIHSSICGLWRRSLCKTKPVLLSHSFFTPTPHPAWFTNGFDNPMSEISGVVTFIPLKFSQTLWQPSHFLPAPNPTPPTRINIIHNYTPQLYSSKQQKLASASCSEHLAKSFHSSLTLFSAPLAPRAANTPMPKSPRSRSRI